MKTPEFRLTLSKRMIADLDKLAEVAEVTRSETIRDLLTLAIDQVLEDDRDDGGGEEEPELEEAVE